MLLFSKLVVTITTILVNVYLFACKNSKYLQNSLDYYGEADCATRSGGAMGDVNIKPGIFYHFSSTTKQFLINKSDCNRL